MKNYTLHINDASGSVQSVKLHHDGSLHSADRVHVPKNSKIQLIDDETQLAPDNVRVERIGNDLYVAFPGTDIASPDLILEDFYTSDGGFASLVGQAENGMLYEYVPESGATSEYVGNIGASIVSGQVLGGSSVPAFYVAGPVAEGGAGGWALAALAIGAAAAGAVIAFGDNDNHNGPAPVVPPPVGPSATGKLADASDSGVKGDSKTNDNTPTITGTGTAGDKITVTLPTGEVLQATVAADGTWSITPTRALPDGPATVTIVETNPAGVSGAPTSVVVTIDTVPPAAPTATLTPTAPSDTGTLGDNLTSNKTPALSGNAEAGSTVTVVVDGTTTYTTTADANGKWSVPTTGTLAEGAHTLSVTSTDAAGNSTTVAGTPFTVDATAPAPTITINAITPDNVVNAAEAGGTIAVTGTVGGEVKVGDTVTLTIGTNTYTGTVAAGNTYSINVPGSVLAANATVTAVVSDTDAAGNTGTAMTSQPYTVDTTAPSAPTAALTHDATNDTGASATDSLTSNKTPSLSGTGEAGTTISVAVDGGTPYTAIVAANGTWTVPTTVALADGPHTLTITSTDAAGNSTAGTTTPFTVDTTAPATGAAPDLTDASDTGVSNTDNITSINKPVLTVSAPAAGETPSLYVDGVKVPATFDPATNTLTPTTPLTDGPHNITSTTTDAAGNESAQSPALAVVIDTTAPATPAAPDMTAATDTGASNTDNITNIKTPAFTVPAPAAGETPSLYVDGVKVPATFDPATNTLTPTNPLTDGTHAITSTTTDAAGNESPQSPPLMTVVDTVAPGAPVITQAIDDVGAVTGNVPSGGNTDDANPQFVGTAEAGSTVKVFDGTTLLGSTTTDATGAWSFTPTSPLANGTRSITATATDAAGNLSGPSNTYGLIVDTNAPQNPAIIAITDDVGAIQGPLQPGARTDDTQPAITGTAAPGVLVQVFDNGTQIGSVTANAAGNWTFTPTLAEGAHSITANAVNAAGVTSPSTGAFPLTVDTTPPAITLTGANDNVGAVQGNIAPNSTTDDSTPTLTGTGEAGAVVKILDGTTVLGSTTVDPSGNWTFTPTTALPDGGHSVTATATDVAGNTSAPTAALPFTINTSAVTDPSIVRITDDVAPITGTVVTGGSTNDTTPTVVGTGPANNTIQIFQNGVQVASTTSDGTGNWSYTPTTGLADNTYSYTARAVNAAGVVSNPSAAYVVTVDTVAPASPVITTVTDDVGAIQGTVAPNGSTDDTTPTVNGTSEANAVVTIRDGATVLGSVTASGTGAWTFTPTTTLGNGPHSFTATATDAAGNVGPASNTYGVVVDTVAPGAPVITQAIDDVGAVTGNVPSGGNTDDANPQFVGTAEAGSTVKVFDGTTLLGSTTTDATGAWSFTPTSPLANGTRSITATATDAAGNLSGPSNTYGLIVDTNAPQNPAIIAITDDVGAIQGPLQPGARTDDTQPAITGTAAPGALVQVFDNGTQIGSVTANAAGNWTFTPTLAEGAHSITANAVNAAGVTSPSTGAFPLTVDTTPPAITLTGANDNVGAVQGNIAPNSTTDDSTPTLTGTGEAGAVVKILDGTTVLGSTTVDPSGNWTFTPTTALPDGGHSVTATATDVAGNTSAPTAALPFIVNTAAVTDPSIVRITDDVAPILGTVSPNGSTNDNTPTVVGSGPANTTIQIFQNGTQVASTTSDGAGNWSYTPATGLADGNYSYTASAVNAAGVVSNLSSPYAVTVDTVAPAAAVITTVTDNVGAIQGTVPNGNSTDDTTPTVNGTSEANAVVIIRDGATVLGSVTASGTGAWTFTPTTTLGNGPHSFTATATDAAGNVGPASNTYGVVVDTVAPVAPVITNAADDVAPVLGNVATGGITNDTTPTLSGTSENNAVVIISDGTTVLGSVTASATGAWTFTPAALTQGAHSFTATATDAAGNVSVVSNTYGLTVDTTAPVAPVIVSATDDVAPVTGIVATGGATNDTTPTLAGTSENNAVVIIRDGATILGSTTASATGAWTFTPAALPEGPHSFTATATDAAGNVSVVSNTYGVVIDTTAPVAPALTSVNDDVGAVKGNVPNGGTTDDNTPTLVGTSEAGAVVTVLDGATVLGTTTADANGNWTFTPTTALTDGGHSVTATATDAAGNVSPATGARTFTIDTSAVTDPSITRITDDVAPITGTVASGNSTNDTTPTVVGTGPVNSTIQIFQNTVLVGSTTSDGAGNWSYTPAALADGTYSYTATALNAAGVASNASSPYSVVVDTVAPTAPVIVSATDDVAPLTGNVPTGGNTNDTTPGLAGTSEGNAIVIIRDGATILGSTTANAAGNWTFTPAALPEGPHSFTATATDAAGNVSVASNTYGLTVDTTAPAAPVIVSATDDVAPVLGNVPTGTTTNDTTPTLAGTSENNAVVIISDGATVLGSTTASATGAWTFTPAALAQGTHSFTATATDAAGNVSVVSNTYGVIVDTTAPAVTLTTVTDDVGPVQGTVPANGTTDDTLPTFSGTSEPGAIVIVRDGATVLGSTTTNVGGSWTFTPTAALADGPHSVTATATDAAGNVSAPTAAVPFTVDTTAPVAPVIVSATDDVAPVLGNVPTGTSTNDTTPTLSGTSENNAVVIISDGTTVLGSVTASATGAWTFTPAALTQGTHSFTATATDAAGNVSVVSNTYGLTVDTTAPVAPVIVSATDDVAPVTGIVATGGATNDTTPTLAGTSENNAVVIISDGATVLGSTTASATGAWTFTPAALPEGPHSFTATATDAAGNVSVVSNTYGVIIDTTAPAAAVITTVTDDVGTIQGTIAPNATTDDTTPTVNGTSEPGAIVIVRDGGTVLGSTTASPTGAWTFTPTTTLGNGPHSFTATATDAAGNVGPASNTYGVVVDTVAPGAPVITQAIDDVGAVTGNVPSGGNTDDANPQFVGTAEAGSTVKVFDGTTLLGSTTTDATGAWSFTPTSPLANGTRSITATATDAAGNLSGPSNTYGLIVDTNAPQNPAIIAITDDVGAIQGPLQPGARTDDTQPAITGTAAPGALVQVFDNGTQIGSVTANAAGNWTFTPTLAEGAHSITANAVNAAGVTSPSTGAFPLTVDTTPPAITLTGANDNVGAVQGNIAPNSTTDDSTPTLTGTGEAGAVVKILDGTTVLGSTTVDPSGNWTFTPTTALPDGGHSVTATATDVAGNTSAPTAALPFIVNTAAVTDPSIVRITDDVAPILGTVSPNGSTNDNTPTVVGSGPANTTIQIFQNGTQVASTTSDGAGNWSYTPATGLADGNYSYTASAVNAAGVVSNLSSPYAVTVDTVAPAAAVITTVTDNVGAIQGTIAPNATTDDTTPTVNGTSEPGAIVIVRDGGTVLGSTTASPTGAWTFTPTTTLGNGPHSFTATATDAAGNVGPASNTYGVVVDTVAPVAPVITNAADDVAPVLGNVATGGITNDTTPTLSGTSENNAVVIISDGTTVLGSVTASATGAWTFTPAALTQGAHSFTATATDAAGNVSVVSNTYGLTVDTTAPVAPVIVSATDDVAPVTGIVATGGATNDTTPTLAGTSENNAVVIIRDGATILGSTTASATGAWTFTPAALPEGPHSFTATATDAAGNVSVVSNTYGVVIDTTAPVAPALTSVNDDVGAVKGNVPNGGTTDDNTPTLVGTSEAGAVVTVLDGATVLGTTTADANGNWTFTPTTALTDGGHSVTATATDAAGNVSPATGARTFTIDTSAVTDPSITRITDDVAPITGTVASGNSTNDTTPTVVGTGPVNSTIQIFQNTVLVGSTTSDGAGNWSYTPAALADGTYSYTATALNAAGVASNASSPYSVVVDTVAPPVTLTTVTDDVGPVQGTVPANGTTDDTLPTFSGASQPGAIVTVRDGATVLGSTTTNAAGNWTFTPTTVLADGPHSVTATATDAAGNVSAPTAAVPFTVDTTAPAAPVIVSATDDVAPVLGNVPTGTTTNDTTPTLAGTSENNAVVIIRDGATILGSTTSNANGAWTFTPATALTEGTHSFTATATDAAGNVSVVSNTYGVIVDTTAPAVTLTTVTDDVGPVQGTVPANGTTDDTLPTFSGTSEPGAIVIVRDGATVLGSTTTNVGGSWTFTPTAALADGPHSVTATATDAAGNVSAPTAAVPFTVDTTAPVAPVIVSATDDVAPVLGNVPTGTSTNDTTPTLSGTSENNAVVIISDGTTVLGSVTASATGAWTFTPAALTQGTHSFTATATDAAGNVSVVSNTYGLTVDTTAPVAPVIVSATDDVAPVTGIVATGGATNDTTPTLAGTSENNAVVIISDGATVLGSTTASATGAWTFTPAALPEGPHSFTATATDAAGNVSVVSNTYGVIIDTTAPAAAVITTVTDDVGTIQGTIAPNATTDDTTPTVNGTSEPGAIVIVRDGGTVLGSTTASPTGAWTFTPTTTLGNGPHSFTATATDAAGNVGPASNTYGVVVDTVAPVAPVITNAADDVAPVLGNVATGGITNDTTPTLSGTSENNAVVIISDGTTVLGSVTASATGAWTFTPAALTQGAHSFTATATDAAGNVSVVSNTYGLTVDTTAPVAPVIVSATDDVAPVTGIVATGGATNDTTPTLAGTSENNAVVIIRDGATILGSTTASATGAWTFTPAALPEGPHSFTATATDAAGNVSVVSNTYGVVIDTTAPVAPALTSVNDDVGAVKGNVPNGGTTDDNTPTLVGTSEAGAVVTVLDGATVLGTTTADANGNWTFTPTTALTDGGHSVTATATDAAGNVSPATGARTFTIDTSAVTDPSITRITDDVAPITGTVASGNSTNDTTPTVVGTGPVNSTIQIFQNTVLVGSTTSDGAGNWSYTPAALADGTYSYTATALNAAGVASNASSPYSVVVDTVAPPVTLTTVTDDVGPVQGTVPANGTTDDTLPTFSGASQPGAIVTVRDGATVLGSTTTNAAGNWTFTPTTVLADGPHSVTATATDAAGNVSAPTAAVPFTVDTTAPAAPVIVSATDDVAPVLGNVPTGTTTNDTTPTLAGTSENNAVVIIRDGATILGSTTSNANGAWTFTPATALTEGTHSFTATATDAAGNVSVVSNTYGVIVDTTAPVAPVIVSATDDVAPVTGIVATGGATNDTTPTLAGTSENNAVVIISDGATVLGSTTASATGAWTFTPAALPEGPHSFTATATDAAGNVSVVSNTYGVIIDTTAPVAPTGVLPADATNDTGVSSTDNITRNQSPTLTGTTEAGTTVVVTVGGVAYTATVTGTTWSVPITATLTDGTYTPTIVATDAAGNSTTANGETFTVDHTNPIPTITVNAITADNVINAAEAGGTVAVTGTVGGEVKVGDTVTLTVGTNTYTGTVAANNTYSINVPGSVLAANTSVTAVVSDTDTAGNTGTGTNSHPYTVDTTAPVAPTGVLPADATNDTGVSSTDNITRNQSPTLTGTTEAGTTVVVTVGGVAYTATVTGTTWSVPITATLTDGTYTPTIVATDAAGNSTTANGETFTVDHTNPIPTITVNAITADNVINAAEAGGTVAVTGTVGGEVKVGDTVTLTVGTNTYTGTVAANNTYSINVPGSVLAANTSVTAVVSDTDTAGNTGTGTNSHPYTVDTTAPVAPTGVLPADATNDTGVSSTDNITRNQSPTLTGTTEAGTTVVVTVGGVAYTATVTGTTWSVPITATLTDGTYTPTIVATDAAGNSTTANGETFTVDHTNPIPTITVNAITADNVINAAEAGGTVAVTGTVGGEVKVGDTVTLTVGTNTYTGTVAANNTYSINVPGSVLAANTSVTAVVSDTDTAGNTGTGTNSHPYTVDTTAPVAPTGVLPADATNDTGVSSTDNITRNQSPTLTGTTEAGTTVVVTVGGVAYTATVTGTTWSVPITATLTDGTYTPTIVATDAAGNSTTANGETFTVDHTNPIPTITVNAITADNVINAAEAGGTVAVTGTVGGEVKVGDTVTLTVGTNTYTGTVAANNTYSINVPGSVLAANTSVTAVVSDTDTAGNTGTGTNSHPYTVDTTAPAVAPTVVINADANNDGLISTAERGAGTTTLSVGIPAGAVTGDVINVYNGATTGTPIATFVVGTGNVTAGSTQTVTGVAIPTDGNTLTTNVTITDAAGNVGPTGTDSALVDTTAPAVAPTVVIVLDTNNNGYISGAEKGAATTTNLSVGIPAGAVTGDVIKVYNGATTGTPIATYTVGTGGVAAGSTQTVTNVPLPAEGATLTANVTITDAAGNVGPTGTDTAIVDTLAPAPTVVIALDTNNDGFINATEKGAATTTNLTVGIPGTAMTGDVITVRNGATVLATYTVGTGGVTAGSTQTVTGVALPANGATLNVTAVLTDAAGNTSTTATDSAIVDTTAPTAPTATLNHVAADDTGVSATDNFTANQKPNLSGVGEIGTTITVTVAGTGGGTYTAVVGANGAWSVPTTGTLSDGQHTLTVTSTDTAGNVTTGTTTPFVVDSTAPTAVPDTLTVTSQTHNLFYGVDANRNLILFDPNSNVRTVIGNAYGPANGLSFLSLALASDGKIYGEEVSTGASRLYTFNPTTGAVTIVGGAANTIAAPTNGDIINALVGDDQGNLYGVATTSGTIYRINTATGVGTIIGSFGQGTAGDVVYEDGKLYASADNNNLYTYTIATNAVSATTVTLPGQTLAIGLESDGTLYGVNNAGNGTHNIYTVNLATGAVANNGHTTTNTAINDLATTGLNGSYTTYKGDLTPGTAGQDSTPDAALGDTLTVTGLVAGTAASASGNISTSAADTSHRVQGTYGELSVLADGTYTYMLDDSLAATKGLGVGTTGTDTFTYTVTNLGGTTATSTFAVTVNGADHSNTPITVVGGANVTGTAGVDHILFGLGTATQATGGAGADRFDWALGSATQATKLTSTITDYSLAQNDVIDLRTLLLGSGVTAANIGNYVQLSGTGNNATLSVDVNGTGTFTAGAAGTTDLTINLTGANVAGDLQGQTALSLYNSGHLVVI